MPRPSSLLDHARASLRDLSANVEFWSLRIVSRSDTELGVRTGIAEPPRLTTDTGAMLTVIDGGGIGYAATADLSTHGLQRALDRACAWARTSAAHGVAHFVAPANAAVQGEFASPNLDAPLPDARSMIEVLMAEDAGAGRDARVVDRYTTLQWSEVDHYWFSNQGGEIIQRHRQVRPNVSVTVHDAGRTQTRSLGGQYNGYCRQGGMEAIAASGLVGSGARIADEALQLLYAPNCPSGRMDLLAMPDQMVLQIHESIGHPLELDRILGDERNFAGTSFVTLDMFGSYRYGSELLNVSFDPTRAEQYASYAYDDDGQPAQKTLLIERGILKRPLGSATSAHRAAQAGHALAPVANARAAGWQRPPIDRMANLNIEPGSSSLDDMIASTERGVLVRTNVSWSIDDMRNKFQFGCEWGQLIENGRLTTVVRNPNYRGTSAAFWRSLAAVGDESTFEVLGTPYCGKGEPGQTIHVGHAAPACLFRQVDVFGAAA